MRTKPAPSGQYRQAVASLAHAERARVVVEVGVYSGKLSRLLVEVPSVERLYLVDPWSAESGAPLGRDQAHMDGIFAEVAGWAAGRWNVKIMRMASVEAAGLIRNDTVDFFETDGDHSLEGIEADITAWLPKVKIGGILCGDNYEIDTVAAGVDRLLPHREFLANGRVWWARRIA